MPGRQMGGGTPSSAIVRLQAYAFGRRGFHRRGACLSDLTG